MPRPTLPQELIDRVVDELAYGQIPKFLRQSQELRSCSLVSKSFYYRIRKLRFNSTTIDIQYGHRESRKLKNLRQILEENSALQREINTFLINCVDDDGTLPHPDELESHGICDIHLPHILSMLPNLRGLWILHFGGLNVNGLRWTLIDQATRSACWNLQQTSPLLTSLTIENITDIPASFIYNFKTLKTLHLGRDSSFVAMDLEANTESTLSSLSNDSAPQASAGHRLNQLTLDETVWLRPAIMQVLFPQLRELALDIMWHEQEDISVFWNMLKNASTLECLSIHGAVLNDFLSPAITIDDLPSLRNLSISAQSIESNNLLSISRFLTPVKHPTRLENFKFDLRWDFRGQVAGEDNFFLVNGWSQLDQGLTSSKAASLCAVNVQILSTYHRQFPYSQAARFKQLLEDWSPSKSMPLLSALDSIDLKVGIKVVFEEGNVVWTFGQL